MKCNYLISSGLIFILAVVLSGCPASKNTDATPNCTSQASSEVSSFNVFDLNPSSGYFNNAIANFSFNQASVIYPNNCKVDSYGNTSLQITNAVNKTISFSYQVTATIGIVTWQYQNVATIAPNASVDVGVINSNPQRLNLGSVVIYTGLITYK